jgi:hypothetical protein
MGKHRPPTEGESVTSRSFLFNLFMLALLVGLMLRGAPLAARPPASQPFLLADPGRGLCSQLGVLMQQSRSLSRSTGFPPTM